MIKYLNNIKTFAAMFLLLTFIASSFVSCTKDDDSSNAVPEINYIRLNDQTKSDSLLVRANLGDVIVLMGNNLNVVKEAWFNDKECLLNNSFITNSNIILSIPQDIPEVVNDSITLVTYSGIRVQYPFQVLAPPPIVRSMECEYVADGENAIIYGDYFLDDPNKRLQVFFHGNIEAEVVDVQLNQLTVKVPEGVNPGPITVKSLYGKGTSSLHFRDNRNVILDFDTRFPDGGYHHGWHDGAGYGTEEGLNGQYLIFAGEMTDGSWNDADFGYERWTYTPDDADFFDSNNLNDHVLKFEVNVTREWSSSALNIIFTGADEVFMNYQDGYDDGGNVSNAYISDETYPRALWIPWEEEGSYITNGWITVSIPMSDFQYNREGETVPINESGHYSGITLFVNEGGVEGTDCTPEIHIDNVRVVPQ